MPLDFECPNGHLLCGEESLVGSECECPQCGAIFIVPPGGPASPAAGRFGQWGPGADPAAAVPFPSPAELVRLPDPSPLKTDPPPSPLPAPAAEIEPLPPAGDALDALPAADVAGLPEEGLLHVPCPLRHVLETPRDLLGQPVLCPYCQTQFTPRYENSVEYRQLLQAERQRREERLGRMWMIGSIVLAVLALGSLLYMIFHMS